MRLFTRRTIVEESTIVRDAQDKLDQKLASDRRELGLLASIKDELDAMVQRMREDPIPIVGQAKDRR